MRKRETTLKDAQKLKARSLPPKGASLPSLSPLRQGLAEFLALGKQRKAEALRLIRLELEALDGDLEAVSGIAHCPQEWL